ncbi:MAG: molybdopterin molybdotransferase MoeA [Proteobacteria bacterium]|nr:molybdopterin molybdotransferase MoeA [Pseudomonadota bacterium]MBU1739776.1 molybdopterin molybdotransferase MoeA [Pseudomonadota bacterium]
MISIDQALDIIKKNLFILDSEEIDLENSPGRVLAADFLAPEPSPRFSNSAMDGFAVRFADIAGASAESPASLKVIGESQAGIPYTGQPEEGCCIRISTGAVLPEGFDTVVRVEDTESGDAGVLVKTASRKGKDVRFIGEEYQTGECLLRQGQHLSARHISILAAAGAARVSVFRRPRVALLVTGSELTSVGEAPGPGQIRDSNRLMLGAAVSEAGGVVVHSAIAGDDLAATVQAIEATFADAPDILLCAGGVSVGPHDHVKEAAVRAGFTEHFWRIRQKPGKPLFFAGKEKTLFFGLPGNPVSAYMCFCHYLRPLFAAISGQPWEYTSFTAVAAEEISNRGRRPNLVRVTCIHTPGELPKARAVGQQGSHMISSIVAADGYVLVDSETVIKGGTPIEVTTLP